MEYYFFILIVILILKVLFWTFYFYVRAQRMRQVRMQRLIIVRSHSRIADSHFPYSDSAAIISNAEPVAVSESLPACPPPYSEVVKESSSLPPPYEVESRFTNTYSTVLHSSDDVPYYCSAADPSLTRSNSLHRAANRSSGNDYTIEGSANQH